MILLYNIGIAAYKFAIILAALFNTKAKLLLLGRKNTWHILNKYKPDSGKKLAWFHCASLGEFEQAKPVIERLKIECDMQIAVSFFSPSGYEIRKNYELADVTFYLPSDSVNHAKKIIELIKPTYVFFVKYEIWLHLINTLFKNNIPIYLLSATFRPNHVYFKWYGKIFKQALKKFSLIFTQDLASTILLNTNGLTNTVFSNDTRYDRVYDASKNPKELPLINLFKQQQQLLVLGSSYAIEEQITANYIKQNTTLKVIVAPHQINPTRLQEVINIFKNFSPILYSQSHQTSIAQNQVLIMDNIGLLASIYRYADMAFVGGGFGKTGIHNTLEAATFGMPIFIGPNNHHKFPEVGLLRTNGILFSISNNQHFIETINSFLNNPSKLQAVKAASQTFIKNNLGATQIVLDKIK